MTKNLMLHYNYMKEYLQDEPKSVTQLYLAMQQVFTDIQYQYIRREVEELVTLKKINKIKHNNQMLLLWNEAPLKFEYELSSNVVKLEKQYTQFVSKVTGVRQIKFPLYMVAELGKHIVDLDQKLELMLGLNAVKSNGVWYKIERGTK